jgi:hypothetical protein
MRAKLHGAQVITMLSKLLSPAFVAQPTPHQLQPRTSRIKTAVPISEITIEPMQPRRFEKNANTSFYFEPGSPID